MAAGTAYSKRYAAGFSDKPATTTPIDSTFLNAVETALLQLIGAAPTADGQVMQWDNANTRFGPALLLNKNIDPAAAIASSKIDFTGGNALTNAAIAGAAAIARSKLDFGSGLVNADIAPAAAIALSKIAVGGSAAQYVNGAGALVKRDVALLCSSVAGGAVASFDTNTILGGNIDQTYNHLRIVFLGRGDTAASSTNFKVTFNNDTGANYNSMQAAWQGGVAPATPSTSLGGAAAIPGDVTAASSTANRAGFVVMDIPMYAATTFHKEGNALISRNENDSGNGQIQYVSSFVWKSTAAITRITVTPGAGNWIAGSGFYVYGVL